MDLELSGRNALVTGSSRGTGAAIAKALAREGAIVFVHGNQQGDQESVARAIIDGGGRAVAVTGDIVTDEGARAVADRVREIGPLDILVNNYGQAHGGTWHDVTAADFVEVYQRNTLSAVRMAQHFVQGMKERGFGRIIQLSTIGVIRPNARMPHYYASKAALSNLTVSLAKELAGTGITVNTVSPGLIKTAELEQFFRHRAKKKGWGDDWDLIEAAGVAEMMPNPSGRMARVDEVADLVAFLASSRAAYINGAQIRIDGGATDVAL